MGNPNYGRKDNGGGESMKFLSVFKQSHFLLAFGIIFLTAGVSGFGRVTEWPDLIMCILETLVALYILYAAYKQACKEAEVKK
ncbi:MAG: hypothetical protein QQM50_07535 [Dehalococcoides mccartyi]|uniref:hypothetical protein n=1 Tax=Dehalococcoides TaxID=61434 RepID=UPI002737BF2A|nr:hypothetical protein [Dehalococcoides mccartyi]MDP4280375.1 hypothetical protein [Dehalococcoides mccartyi]